MARNSLGPSATNFGTAARIFVKLLPGLTYNIKVVQATKIGDDPVSWINQPVLAYYTRATSMTC